MSKIYWKKLQDGINWVVCVFLGIFEKSTIGSRNVLYSFQYTKVIPMVRICMLLPSFTYILDYSDMHYMHRAPIAMHEFHKKYHGQYHKPKPMHHMHDYHGDERRHWVPYASSLIEVLINAREKRKYDDDDDDDDYDDDDRDHRKIYYFIIQ